MLIREDTASGLVREALALFAAAPDGGHDYDQTRPRGLPVRERRNVVYVLEDPTRCAAWLPERRLNYPFMVAEWAWMFCGRHDVGSIAYYNQAIKEFSDDGRTFFGAYGPRWRGQIAGVVGNLKKDPDSRQGVVCTWRPEVWPFAEGLERMPRDVPCTLSMQYQLRHDRLHATVVMRSSDAWLGLPYDLFNFSMLQRAVASELGADVGPLVLFVGNAHLYERDLPRVQEVLSQGLDSTRHVQVPAPPDGVRCDRLHAFEERARQGELALLDQDSPWWPLVSMLRYRSHRDPERVAPPLDRLVRP